MSIPVAENALATTARNNMEFGGGVFGMADDVLFSVAWIIQRDAAKAGRLGTKRLREGRLGGGGRLGGKRGSKLSHGGRKKQGEGMIIAFAAFLNDSGADTYVPETRGNGVVLIG